MVIDVWRTRAARRADWFIPIRVGTDAALALGMAHVLHRDNLIDHDYIQRLVLGYERWAQEVLPRYTPAAVETITGVPASDVETLARAYGQAKRPSSGSARDCHAMPVAARPRGPSSASPGWSGPGSALAVAPCWPRRQLQV